MNRLEVLAQFDREQRRDIQFPDMERQALPRVVRFVRPAPGMCFVLYSELDEATADETIEEQIAFFRRGGRPFEWKVFSHDRPADLVQRLAARGFELEEPDAVMVLDLHHAPPGLPAEPEADVRRLTDPRQLADVATVLEAVWNREFNWIHERMGAHMAIPGYLSVFVAYVDGKPAGAGWTYYNGSFAGIWGGSTLEEYRGRGLYTAVLAARAREARERGFRYLVIDAGEMSRPIVEKHGFEFLTSATSCVWKSDGNA